MNLMLPTGPTLRLEDFPTLSLCSSEGCEVDCGSPWSEEGLAASVEHGPHKGDMSEEIYSWSMTMWKYQVKAGFAEIHLWDNLKSDPPSNLKNSPVTVIPKPDQRGCIILDLLFPVYRKAAGGRRR